MFVHAFQSALFNQTLEERVKKKKLFSAQADDEYCGKNAFDFPDVDVLKKVEKKQVEKVSGELASGSAFLVGKVFGSDSELTAAEKKMLKKAGLTQDSFKFKTMPWLSSRGNKRALAVPLKNFQVLGENPAVIRFELPAGSYATVAVKHLLE
jgi:tRNA pseudouridine13 synthase